MCPSFSLSVCQCSKRKMSWAINTDIGINIACGRLVMGIRRCVSIWLQVLFYFNVCLFVVRSMMLRKKRSLRQLLTLDWVPWLRTRRHLKMWQRLRQAHPCWESLVQPNQKVQNVTIYYILKLFQVVANGHSSYWSMLFSEFFWALQIKTLLGFVCQILSYFSVI